MPNNPFRPVITWLFCGCFLIYAMVVIGGITRLTHSGLSMVEWNMIIGSRPPMNEAEWQIPFEKYKQSPEYQIINSHFTLDEFKSIYWWEYSHRFLGRFIGLIFIIPFIYFLTRKKIPGPLFKKLLFILMLGAFQGALGWYMVKSGLIKNPHVSHYRLTAHLLSAFAVFGLTFYVALGLLYPKREQADKKTDHGIIHLRRAAILLFCLVVLQITYGGFVAGLKAGYLCPTWPKMCDVWIHDAVFALQPLWKNFLEDPISIQFIHRYLAYALALLVVYIYFKSQKVKSLSTLQKRIALTLLIIVSLQFLLGVLTIIYSVPAPLGVLHQTGAFFLFACTLLFIHRLGSTTCQP